MKYFADRITEDVLKFKIDFEQEDFKRDLKNRIKSYAKDLHHPGFRKGKLPAGLINKKLKPEVLKDLVLLRSRSLLDQFLETEKRGILLGPVISNEELLSEQILKGETISVELYSYLNPQFRLNYDVLTDMIFENRIANQEYIEKRISLIRKENAKPISNEEFQEGDEWCYNIIVGYPSIFNYDAYIQFKIYSDDIQKTEYLQMLSEAKPGDKLTICLKEVLGVQYHELNPHFDFALDECKEVTFFKSWVIRKPEFHFKLVQMEYPYFENITDENYLELFMEGIQGDLFGASERFFYFRIIYRLIEQSKLSLSMEHVSRFIHIPKELRNSSSPEQLERYKKIIVFEILRSLIEQQIVEQENLRYDSKLEMKLRSNIIADLLKSQGKNIDDFADDNSDFVDEWLDQHEDLITSLVGREVSRMIIVEFLLSRFDFKTKDVVPYERNDRVY